MNMKYSIRFAITFFSIQLLFTGCASNPNKAKNIDTSLENTSSVNGDTTLGIKDGYMVVQKKVMMNEELRKLQYAVYE